MTEPGEQLSHQDELDLGELAEVLSLIDAATEADGVSPVSEHVLLHLRHGGDGEADNLLVHSVDGRLAGYAHLDRTDLVGGSSAELAVHPEHRRRGVAGALVRGLEARSPDGRLRLWAHGQLPGARALADRFGYRQARVLWQMRRSLLSGLPTGPMPQGVELRTFVVGRDEQAWTELNNRAFANHPDQGGWSVSQIQMREKETWFDPEGFLLAVDTADGRLLGFHWTKVHGRDGGPHAHEPIGEVYALGIDPSAQGRGLAPALTVAGLRYLRNLGLSQVMLYVDEANTGAIRVYERVGFTRWDVDVSYRRSGLALDPAIGRRGQEEHHPDHKEPEEPFDDQTEH